MRDLRKSQWFGFILAFLVLLVKSKTSAWADATKRIVLDELQASVNSSLILLSDIRKFREIVKLRSQLDPLFAGTPMATQGSKSSTQDIIDFLINERLITQQFPKTNSEVEQEINSIQSNNRLDRAGLKEALEKEGYGFSDYFELIRDSGSKRDLIDREIRTKITISEDDIKNYFYNHYSHDSSQPRAFHLQMVTISANSFKAKSKAAASDLANQSANRALYAIRSGEPFEEVAKRVNDDGSASHGGDLGILTEDQVSPLIREQVKKLKVGEVSEILLDPKLSRYSILKLVDVKTNQTDHLNEIREEIRNQLTAREYQHQLSLWLERQRQSAFIHRIGEPPVSEILLSK